MHVASPLEPIPGVRKMESLFDGIRTAALGARQGSLQSWPVYCQTDQQAANKANAMPCRPRAGTLRSAILEGEIASDYKTSTKRGHYLSQ